jgi:integrase/recombinase XerD
MKILDSFVSSIGEIITKYITLKQSLGRKYLTEYKILRDLDSFLYKYQSNLTAESFAAWCYTKLHLNTTVQRKRMQVVRNFCLYRKRTEFSCFVPDPLQFPKASPRTQAYIFTEVDIIHLLDATNQLKPNIRSPLRRENFRLALILLYTSGLRSSELLRLTIGDYNSKEHLLLIRESKFHKSRIIPLSKDGWTELEAFLKIRFSHQIPHSADSPLLWNAYEKKGAYNENALRRTFRPIFCALNIRNMGGHLPRVHDLRHTFAVHALLRWYREGLDVQAKLPFLSIYMGHISIVSTEYYLQFIGESVDLASERFAKRCSKLISLPDEGGSL